MKSPHLLNLANARKVKQNLSGILSTDALAQIEQEIEKNARQLYALGRRHYLFALAQPSSQWRQKVSRLYYAAYNVSRAVRLHESGEYSNDVKDHQKFDSLSKAFPDKARYANQLNVLREDRNTCDYDHTARAADLVLGTTESTKLVAQFLADAKTYLQSNGLDV